MHGGHGIPKGCIQQQKEEMWGQVSQENQLQGCKVIQEDGKTLTYREKIRKNNDPYEKQECIFECK